MSRIQEMSSVIKELRQTAASLTDTANWLADTFISAEEDNPTTPTHTFEKVRAILVEKSQDGHAAEVRELLKKYGAEKLSAINPADYDALIRDAEVI